MLRIVGIYQVPRSKVLTAMLNPKITKAEYRRESLYEMNMNSRVFQDKQSTVL